MIVPPLNDNYGKYIKIKDIITLFTRIHTMEFIKAYIPSKKSVTEEYTHTG